MIDVVTAEEQYMEMTNPVSDERFRVDSISSAEWCLKRIAWHEKKKKDAAEFVAAEKAKLEEYLATVNGEADNNIAYFRELLMPFAMEQLEGSKAKTFKLPSGNLSFKKQSPLFEIDEKALLAFTKDNAPEFVKVKESVDWAGYKKTVTLADGGVIVDADGQVVEGVSYVARPDAFSVTVK